MSLTKNVSVTFTTATTSAYTDPSNIDWTTPANAEVSNDAYATALLTKGVALADTSFRLMLTGQSGADVIPTNATITGITVSIEKSASGLAGCVDREIMLIKNGALAGNDKSLVPNWPSSDAVSTYGSSSDLWGNTLTPANVKASNFGVSLVTQASSGTNGQTATVKVDAITMVITYTTLRFSNNASLIGNQGNPTSLGIGTNTFGKQLKTKVGNRGKIGS